MRRRLLLAIALGVVATFAAAFGVGCSKTNEADDTPKHNYGEWVIDREASCIEAGIKHHTCKDCNETEWESIPKTDHIFSIPNRANIGHSFTCSLCKTTSEMQTHSYKNGICTACGAEEGGNFDYKYTLSKDESYYIFEQSLSRRDFTEIIIPSACFGIPVKEIGVGAFFKHENLISVTIPDSITAINGHAFQECSSLSSITIPDGVTSIGEYTFDRCSSLTNIEIPNSVTSIGECAFLYCSSLTNIEIGNSVTNIGEYAFEKCNISSITIPDSITNIEETAFIDCKNLAEIIVSENNNFYKTIGGNLYSKDGKTLVKYLGKQTEFTIPQTVTTIGSYAFYKCDKLQNVTITSSVINICENAFWNCSNLGNIIIPRSVTVIGEYGISYPWLIYCEAESKPDGWNENWCETKSGQIVWGYKSENNN